MVVLNTKVNLDLKNIHLFEIDQINFSWKRTLWYSTATFQTVVYFRQAITYHALTICNLQSL